VRPSERAASRQTLGAREEDLVFAFVSHNFKLRGLGQLIRALAQARSSIARGTLKLVVVGRGDSRGPHELARSLGLEARFVGEVEDVRPFLKAADLFALPTLYDPCSLATLEALACGLPVVTTRRNGATELFEESAGVAIEDPRDLQAMTAAIVSFFDPGRRREAAAAAREAALRNPADRAFVRQVEVVETAVPVLPRGSADEVAIGS